MSNYTFEDYKNAIKAKYEEEKNGDYSNNLNSPTSANLRNLCVKRFDANNSKDDLIAFQSFFDFPFDKDKKNLFGDDELNKLEAVKRFFLGRTDKPAEDTIQLAAILVDLQPRPFKEFKKQHDAEDVKMLNKLRNNLPEKEVLANEAIEEKKPESIMDSFASFPDEEPELVEPEKIVLKPTTIQSLVDIGEKPKPPKPPSTKSRYFAIAGGLFLLCLLVYYVSTQNQCMQWTGDHYEKVDCDLKIEGIGTAAHIEILDKSLVNLQKVNACDTTTYFDKNGTAIIWYAKTANGIDFFNSHGRHPESGNSLKPVTEYILGKYVYGKGLKCE
ncbi:hypothetical protein [Flavobacterium branchiicola]|uniref:Uncharacterized protein n=1 Tax=Flavobacterium branchiicola TaxID=1114875 RepID=A0ABV9PCR0_9FLAO|nr:hypothetical protein [Flavobacterium branchiicola]MBS7254546.1 hypothetical protein [Flavobacterium branchiicola]